MTPPLPVYPLPRVAPTPFHPSYSYPLTPPHLTKKRKKQDDVVKLTEAVNKNRESYQDVIKQYEFLDDLDEIAAYDISKPDEIKSAKKKEEAGDKTLLNISMDNNKNRIKFGDDFAWCDQVDVTQNLMQEELESIEKYSF